jgi:hypothetical protein
MNIVIPFDNFWNFFLSIDWYRPDNENSKKGMNYLFGGLQTILITDRQRIRKNWKFLVLGRMHSLNTMH